MRKVVFMDFHGTIAYKSYSETLHQVLSEAHPDHLYTQSTFRDLLDGSYLWDSPEMAHPQYNKPEAWWSHMEEKLTEAYSQLGYKQDAAQMAKRFRELYTDAKEYMIYEDSLEAIIKIRKMGWKIVIISNHVPELKDIVKAMLFGKYIRKVISSANIGYEKPHPKFYNYALKKTCRPRKKIVIGDSILADIQGAAAAGIPAILVRNSLFKDSGDCRYFAQDMMEAAQIIEENFK